MFLSNLFFHHKKPKVQHIKVQPLIFITTSLFLHDCFKYLTSMGENEVMHFVTGINMGRIRILDYMQKVVMESQTPVYVKAEINSVFDSLIWMDEVFGHTLNAYFHRHPESFSSPSGIDLAYQKRLEAGGYESIGAIFTSDGQIRFFADKLPFIVEVYGKGVEKIHDTLFQFTTTDFNKN